MTSSPNPAEDEPIEQQEAPAETGEGSEIEAAQGEIARLNEELHKMRDQWVRAVAETENVRKRGQRDIEESSRYAITNFAREMVSVLENLKRASESMPVSERGDNEKLKIIGEGVDLTLGELMGIFERFGIKRIDPMGQKFDHNAHQAVVQVERDDVPAGTVVQVVQSGYIIQDRLLRPAMVAVSKQPDASKKVDTTA